ncbi:MAG: rod shape-determining protein MreC [Candidatus Moranbacteria bacterium]|jgi:rod shape-determining protein MreC|nr:rod shape-determining protein MreC [Candidatus Moranbacteria bacterium]
MAFFNKKTRTLFIFIILFFTFLLVVRNGKLDFGKNVVFYFFQPFEKFFSSAGYFVGEKIDFFSSIGELKESNHSLTKENLELKAKLAQLKDIEKENIELRREIGLAPRDEYDLEAALIIGKDLVEKDEAVFIDKGDRQGIRPGMPVLIGGGVLVGRVKDVSYNQSSVELILSKNSNISAELESGEKGIVRGEYGTSAILDMIPQTAQIKNQDEVITSGLNGDIPRGMLIGYVKEVLPSTDYLFQAASINLPYEIEKIRLVWVLKSKK